MTNYIIIILFLIIFGSLPILRTDFFVMYIIQLKNYRLDRIRDFLWTPEWKRAFWNKTLLAYVVVFILYYVSYLFFNNSFFFPLSRVLIGMLFLDSIYVLRKIKRGSLLIPKMTKRSIMLSIMVIGVQIIIFLAGYFMQHFFIAMLILLLWVYFIVGLSTAVLSPFVRYQKKKIFASANNRMRKYTPITVWITWSFWKSSVKTMLSQLIPKKFNTVSTPENINTETWVSQVILDNITKHTDYFISEMWAYKKWEIRLLGDIVNHKYWFLTGIWNQHLSLFKNQENISKAKREIVESVLQKKWKLYLNTQAFSFLRKAGINAHSYKSILVSYWVDEWDAQARDLQHVWELTKFKFMYKDKQRNLETNLLWRHNLINLSWVLAFLVDQWISPNVLRDNLKNMKVPSKTLQVHILKSSVTLIDDSYNLSVDGLYAGLEFMQHFDWEKILVLDDILELWTRSKKIHYEIGKKISKYELDKIFLVWKNYRKDIKSGLEISWFQSNRIFYKWDLALLKTISSGVVLLEWRDAGKLFQWL